MSQNQSLVIRPNQMAVELSCSMATVWRLLKSGAIPKIQISPRAVGCLRSDLTAYLESMRTGGL